MEPDDANFDDATLGVVSRYATRFVFISLRSFHRDDDDDIRHFLNGFGV